LKRSREEEITQRARQTHLPTRGEKYYNRSVQKRLQRKKKALAEVIVTTNATIPDQRKKREKTGSSAIEDKGEGKKGKKGKGEIMKRPPSRLL